MKRCIHLLAIGGFFFILSIPVKSSHAKSFSPIQFGPFASQTDCNTTAALFTTVSSSVSGYNPFWLPNSVTTACWSDS